jgi:2-methylcitrate dehydratase PrpD
MKTHSSTVIQPGPTARIAAFVADLSYDDLSVAERHAVARHLLDTLGACIAGSQAAAATIAADLLAELLPPGNVPVPGLSRRWDVFSAAYLAGAGAHGLEVDDGYRAGSVHPGTVIIPALLAIGSAHAIDGRRLTAGIAAGYEVTTRIAETIHPESRRRGFHNTPVAGVIGVAAAASVALGLAKPKVEHALGIAASSAGGLFAFLEGGGEIKRLHPGFAAREGIFAALLAKRGMTGPLGVLEGKDGFQQAFSGRTDRDPSDGLVVGGATPLNITRCYMKPYACCRHIHPAIDAVLRLIRREGLTATDIERIKVGTYAIAAAHAAGSWNDMASAQLNYLFCVATALRHSAVSIGHFEKANLNDPATNDLCRRIAVTVDAECEDTYPATRAARVVLTLKDGRRLAEFVDEPSGSARYPLSDDEVSAKFHMLVTPVLGPQAAERLAAMVWSFEKLATTAALLEATKAE